MKTAIIILGKHDYFFEQIFCCHIGLNKHWLFQNLFAKTILFLAVLGIVICMVAYSSAQSTYFFYFIITWLWDQVLDKLFFEIYGQQ